LELDGLKPSSLMATKIQFFIVPGCAPQRIILA
jgi:hypothetical protein